MSDFDVWTQEQIDRERAESLRVHCILAQAEIERLEAALASKDAEIERLRWALEFYAFRANWTVPALGHERSPVGLDGGDMARRALDPEITIGAGSGTPNRAAGATPHPRSEVPGFPAPGNHSGDPE